MATSNHYEGYINYQRLMRVMQDINNASNAGTAPNVRDAYMYIFKPETWTYSIEKTTSPKPCERKALKDFL